MSNKFGITKGYVFGGEMFPTYAEAMAARKAGANRTMRDGVRDLLDREVNWEGWTGDTSEIIDALFAVYNITPKKRAAK